MRDDMTSGKKFEEIHGRIFEEIVVEYPSYCIYPEYKGKPYFSIKYTENGEGFIGYGTYNPKVLSEYLKEYFMPSAQSEADEVARDMAKIIENEKDMRVIQKNAEQQWIPCSERMPDTYTTVLVTHRGGVSFAWHNGRYWTRGAMSKRKELTTVKAWMPLPDPYREESR